MYTNKNQLRQQQRGYSLVELSIALAIIAVIIVIIYSYRIQKEVHALTEQSQRVAALRNSVLIESLSKKSDTV